MAFLSTSPRSRHRGRRNNNNNSKLTVVLTIIVLVLSQNVWQTLTCYTSSSQPRNNHPRLHHSTSTSASSGEYEGGMMVGFNTENVEPDEGIFRFDDGNWNFEKKSGGNMEPEERLQACQIRLLDSVTTICGVNNFHVPSGVLQPLAQTQTTGTLNGLLGLSKRALIEGELLQRRMTRSLVNECCNKSCSRDYLKRFCKDQSRIPVPVTTPRPTAVTEPMESLDMDDSEFVAQAPRQSAVNILTSTVPPDVTFVRLGPITDDEAPYVKRK